MTALGIDAPACAREPCPPAQVNECGANIRSALTPALFLACAVQSFVTIAIRRGRPPAC